MGAVRNVSGEHLIENQLSFSSDCLTINGTNRSLDFDIPGSGRLLVIGVGKAAASLASGLERLLGERIDDGIVIVKYDHTLPLTRIRQIEAGHPAPDENGVSATREMRALLSGLTANDRVIVLLTGGASSLLVSPAAGVHLSDKIGLTNRLLQSGASISDINTVRKALSDVKGGGLLKDISPASSLTLLISDVPGDDIRTIGSAPTVPDDRDDRDPKAILKRFGLWQGLPSPLASAIETYRPGKTCLPDVQGRHDSVVLARSCDLVAAASQIAQDYGLSVRIQNACMTGHTHREAEAMAQAVRKAVNSGEQNLLLIAAGETTLEVKGKGTGGRNQEYALCAARLLSGVDGVTMLCAGTDGTDGPTSAAGAIVDGASWSRAECMGLAPAAALADNDSHPLLARIGALLVTGPTGTNVMDLVLVLVRPTCLERTDLPAKTIERGAA